MMVTFKQVLRLQVVESSAHQIQHLRSSLGGSAGWVDDNPTKWERGVLFYDCLKILLWKVDFIILLDFLPHEAIPLFGLL